MKSDQLPYNYQIYYHKYNNQKYYSFEFELIQS